MYYFERQLFNKYLICTILFAELKIVNTYGDLYMNLVSFIKKRYNFVYAKKVFRMKVVKYFFRWVALVVMVGLMWGKSIIAVAGGPTSSPNYWTDSLRVSIADSTVVTTTNGRYLEFKIVVERLNEDWNTPSSVVDSVLGNCDLYFYANFEAFDGIPEFTHVHDSLSVGINPLPDGSGNHDAILQANVGIWAERLHIALTRQDQGNTLMGVTVNPNAKYKLKLAVGKPDTLCTVHWRLKPTLAVNLGLRWDSGPKGSTGLQTYGGNPIIETLTGDILKLPDDLLDVDCMPQELYACEGGSVAIGLHAESTGSGLVFEWYDSIPGGGQSYPVLASATTQDQTTVGGKRYTYDYRFSAAGDTLYIDKVPNSIDSIYFYCLVSDTTLTTRPPVYCKTHLFVRDSIKGFVSPLNSIYTLNKIDTVTVCPEDSVVSVRFNFFGVTDDELADLDSVYMIFRNDPCNGDILTEDTVGINMNTRPVHGGDSTINGMPVWYWDAPIKVKRGKVYIQKIGTYYCENAAVAVEYDTIFIKEDNLQMLPRVTVAAKGTVIMDSVTSTIFSSTQSYTGLILTSLRDLGTPTKVSSRKLPFSYTAKDTTGLDTVLYENVPGRQCAYMREVEVQDMKYLTLKVYLWGAWRSALNSMYAFMGREQDLNKYTNMLNGVGSYKSPDSTCLIPANRLRQLVKNRDLNGEVKFVDWVRVDLVKAKSTVNPVKPLVITHKIDSISGFLRVDGVVCDTAGNPYLSFKNLPDTSYYVIVRHRNHLGIISNKEITLRNIVPNPLSTVMVDFTSTVAPIVAGQVNIAYYKPNGVNNLFMFPGNVDGNDRISTPDRNLIYKENHSAMNYYLWDIDFNQRCNMVDVNFWDEVNKLLIQSPVEAFR